MSTIFISVGQCGNQLSNSLINHLNSNRNGQVSYLFNHFDDKFHFINLDSEIKVINGLLNEHRVHLRSENVINTKCGRGSNWASGYQGLKKDGALKIIELSMEAIRRESERCDFLLNFNLMHSLSGGTGSGCGSRLIQELRDTYGSKKYLFTQSVAPFSDGELPLQHYNNLLAMSHLNQFVDSIMLYQNDDILNMAEKLNNENNSLKTSFSAQNLKIAQNSRLVKKSASNDNLAANTVSMEEMNNLIVKSFLNTIYPVDNVSLKTQSFGMEFLELQRFLCSNPMLKIIEIYNVSKSEAASQFSNLNQAGKSHPLLKSLMATVPKYRKQNFNQQLTSLNSLIIARGGQYDQNGLSLSVAQLWQEFDSIKKFLNPVEWNPFTVDFWSSKNFINEPGVINAAPNHKSTINLSLTMALNRNKCVDYLDDVRRKAAAKFRQKAYLHWYHKFGVTDDHFHEAFENVQFIIDSYEQMTK